MNCDYECIRKWAKLLTYACAGAIFGLSVSKFFTMVNLTNPIDYIINVYLM